LEGSIYFEGSVGVRVVDMGDAEAAAGTSKREQEGAAEIDMVVDGKQVDVDRVVVGTMKQVWAALLPGVRFVERT
jgi:hypothetical protein